MYDERVEIIKGRIFKMSPPYHQQISVKIASKLLFLKGKACKELTAPFDVRFPNGSTEDKDIYTVLQPDICVIWDAAKLDDRGCVGVPD